MTHIPDLSGVLLRMSNELDEARSEIVRLRARLTITDEKVEAAAESAFEHIAGWKWESSNWSEAYEDERGWARTAARAALLAAGMEADADVLEAGARKCRRALEGNHA